MLLKIGELASRTGLTVRTLHHYDKIGLLTPSVRSDAGYRLYDRSDITRLHRIQALRRLDLSLAEVARLIDGEGLKLQDVIDQQIVTLDHQIAQSVTLRNRLQELVTTLRTREEPNLEYWLSTLEMMSLQGKYFNEDEIAQLRAHGELRHNKLELEMRPVIAAMRALMDQKVPFSDSRALDLTRTWLKIMHDSVPDPGLISQLSQMQRQEPSLQFLSGIDDEMMDYVTRSSIEIRYNNFRAFLSEDELQYFRAAFMKNAPVWVVIFTEVRKKMQLGLPPDAPEVRPLLQQWLNLFAETWGFRQDVMVKVRELHMRVPALMVDGGLTPQLTPELLAYARTGFDAIHKHAAQVASMPSEPSA